MSQILDKKRQYLSWLAFIEHRELWPEVQPMIANSWKRCSARLNPYTETIPKHVSNDHLLTSQVASFDLLTISRPVMEDIYQFAENSDSIVALSNSAGLILDMCGDIAMVETVKRKKLCPGYYVSEAEIGTNAFGLATRARSPARVVGAEHYLQRYHEFSTTAAPVYGVSGRLLGAIGLVTPIDRYHPHTLSLAVAGARAIESQLQSDYLLAEQNDYLAQLNAILEANSQSILVWSAEQVLMHINPAAAKILGMAERSLLGRHIGEFIKFPEFILEAVEKGEQLTDVEVNLNVDGRRVSCVISLRYVVTDHELQWVIFTARQEKDVRRLVQSQVGAHASFTLTDLPGESVYMQQVRRFVKTAGVTEACILIKGENGTGKNPVASAIHNESARCDGPFLIYPCSSIPSEISIQELVGFEVGVSEQIPGGQPSKFELAQGGTLYFQDVEALPLEAQGLLLNVIDLGIAQRLGSKRPIEVDVRIIAATSADIRAKVAQGNFRADLFYRLSSLEVQLPALRVRNADLPVLLERIITRLSKQLRRPIDMDPEVIPLLENYFWPGNLRELEAVIYRAVVQAGFSGVITPALLPYYVRSPQESENFLGNQRRIQSLNEVERETILNAARMLNGNVSKMARFLGIGRTTVWRKLNAFDISVEEFRNPNNPL